MIPHINVRFFTLANIPIPDTYETEVDVVEITESQFTELAKIRHSEITYKRHSVFENGCRQVCVTVITINTPDVEDIEIADLTGLATNPRDAMVRNALLKAKETILDANRNGFTRGLETLGIINTTLKA